MTSSSGWEVLLTTEEEDRVQKNSSILLDTLPPVDEWMNEMCASTPIEIVPMGISISIPSAVRTQYRFDPFHVTQNDTRVSRIWSAFS